MVKQHPDGIMCKVKAAHFMVFRKQREMNRDRGRERIENGMDQSFDLPFKGTPSVT